MLVNKIVHNPLVQYNMCTECRENNITECVYNLCSVEELGNIIGLLLCSNCVADPDNFAPDPDPVFKILDPA